MTGLSISKTTQVEKFILFIVLLFALSGCQRITIDHDDAADRLKMYYLTELDQFKGQLLVFRSSIKPEAKLESDLQVLRNQFKRIEFVLEYTDKQTHRLFNGAPVLSEDPAATSSKVIQPAGLQVLDQSLCAEKKDLIQLVKLTDDLLHQTELLRIYIEKSDLPPHFYIRAIQLQLIRLVFLFKAGL